MQNGELISWEEIGRMRQGLDCCSSSKMLRYCHICPYNDWTTSERCICELQENIKEFLDNILKGDIKIDGNSI